MKRAVIGVVSMIATLSLVGCGSTQPADDGAGPLERRREPAPAPDPSAIARAKNQHGAAMVQLSWDKERRFTIIYQGGNGDTSHTLRWSPYRDNEGNWKGLFQTAVTVSPGDTVKISGAPIAFQDGLATVAIYYLGADLCKDVPGSHSLSGPVGCSVIIPS
jgi:hypothetical protein